MAQLDGAPGVHATPYARLPLPCLMLVTDRKACAGVDNLVQAVVAAIEGGVNAVQLREKDLCSAESLTLARRMRKLTAGRALLLVNGSLEVALAAGADGVHLPEGVAFPDRPSRPFLVGRSVHSVEAAKAAWAECSDYLIAGPVYRTASHRGSAAAGVRLVEAISAAVAVPVIAIGGITAERVADVIRAGASGAAVISALLRADSPRDAARELSEALHGSFVLRDERE